MGGPNVRAPARSVRVSVTVTCMWVMAGGVDDVSIYDAIRGIFDGAVGTDRHLLTFENANHNAAAPIPAPMERRAGRFRAQLLIQAKDRKALARVIRKTIHKVAESRIAGRVRWSIDVDPIDLY